MGLVYNHKWRCLHHPVIQSRRHSRLVFFYGRNVQHLRKDKTKVVMILDQENNYFTSYADEAAPYVVGDNTKDVLNSLANITQELFTWFFNNRMKANRDNCHLLLNTHEDANNQISSRKLFGLVLGNKLKFEDA